MAAARPGHRRDAPPHIPRWLSELAAFEFVGAAVAPSSWRDDTLSANDVEIIMPEGDVEPDLRPPRVADASHLVEVADSVWILPDHERTPHVANIGIVVGDRSALVVESGIGIENGRRVLAMVREIVGERPLFLTASHFHPEHGLGAQAFAGEATIILNRAQRDELFEKCRAYVDLFSTFTPAIAEALEGVELVPPDVVYEDRAWLDLGDRVVELRQHGDGHTRGDQLVVLPAERVVFAGDLVEERFFAILPDGDADGDVWIRRLEEMERLDPKVVVPGHGAVGGPELAAAARESLEGIRDRALELQRAGQPSDAVAAAVRAEMAERYPDWGNLEWVGPAARSFLAAGPA
jgi:glyoxylase-like metal-dependent hydrolase (beta-lactamase superfamily II)